MSAMSIVDLHSYLAEQINEILNDNDDPNRYIIDIREHYVVRPPAHCTRDREKKLVFLVGVF